MGSQQFLLGGGSGGVIDYPITANTQQLSINVSGLPGYTAGQTTLRINVASGIYVWSDVVATPALTITGGVAGDKVELVNNGFIMGKGGSAINQSYGAGNPGGPAISCSIPIRVNTDNGYIGGGGGSGGSGYSTINIKGESTQTGGGGGGGAGGGRGGDFYSNVLGVSYGGAGGTIGAAGATSVPAVRSSPGGGGGGRIMPGVGGAAIGEGGGAGGSASIANRGGGSGGDPGLNPTGLPDGGDYGGGGGWGAAGGGSAYHNFDNSAHANYLGGAGGKSILCSAGVTTENGTTSAVYSSSSNPTGRIYGAFG
jgi:hypothetical protein